MDTNDTTTTQAGPADEAEAAQYAQFKAAQAATATYEEAMRGNGSESPFTRWLTRKPLPIKFTVNRGICGAIWAFWTLVLAVAVFAAPGAGAGFACFVLAALTGYYDWRIWTRRATSLWFFIVF